MRDFQNSCLFYSYQMGGIKDLHLSDGAGTGVGQEAVVGVGRQAAEPQRVWRGVPDGVQHLHVPDIVDVQALLQAYY